MTPDRIGAHLAHRLPELGPTGDPAPLAGGLLNHVWRVQVGEGSVVVKHAPPHIATAPDVPLDPSRIAFEARALADLSPGGRLAHLAGDAVRAPRLLDFDPDAAVLVMEDLGDLPHLGGALHAGRDLDREARRLGRFIGRLHAETLDRPDLAVRFDNRPIQQTRHRVQYLAVGDILRCAGVPDAANLGARTADLSRRLQRSGRCLLMGDLWPPSIRLAPDGRLLVVDWEFAHYGQPAQDLGHIAAHLWMLEHRAPSAEATDAARGAWRAFRQGYDDGAGDRKPDLLDADTYRDVALHVAAEILVRAAGPFQQGFLYEGCDASDDPAAEAVAAAADLLRDPERHAPFV